MESPQWFVAQLTVEFTETTSGSLTEVLAGEMWNPVFDEGSKRRGQSGGSGSGLSTLSTAHPFRSEACLVDDGNA
jgi:hypothetical protein